jgi:glycosylphosphatidylinositol deacylase
MCLIFAMIFLFIPWQVAFLGCWIIFLYSCANLPSRRSPIDISATIPLINLDQSQVVAEDNSAIISVSDAESHPKSPWDNQVDRLGHHHGNMHLLLLMTWLLPLTAPILVVWVRTLMTAGYTVPFSGDHNFLNVAPFLLLVDSSNQMSAVDIRSVHLFCGGFDSNLMLVIVIAIGCATPSNGPSSVLLSLQYSQDHE